jgi:hypothetical protein
MYDQATPERERPKSHPPIIIAFAIVTAVFSRPSDPTFQTPCLMSFASITRQTYPHWILVLIGDGLLPQEVGRVFKAAEAAGIPRDKLIFRNMDESLREKHIYSSNDSQAIWFHSGTNALNLGLLSAYNISPSMVTHIARIDDDDYWMEDHLQNLADAYTEFPNASFAHSQAIYGPRGPFPAVNSTTDRIFERTPQPCGLIHATASWSVSLRTFFRQAEEQKASPRAPGKLACCHHNPCTQGVVLPADADMWEQVRKNVVEGSISSAVFVNAVDVHYSDSAEKRCISSTISSGRLSPPECAKTLHYVHDLSNSNNNRTSCLSL